MPRLRVAGAARPSAGTRVPSGRRASLPALPMEAAATPLRHPRVTVLHNGVVVDALTVDDETTVALVRARAEAGEDPARLVTDAIEIGARVLDREHAGANAEF